ncbi:hypothetical protein BH09VER1_BH09VER1_44550 [soil metagenome]
MASPKKLAGFLLALVALSSAAWAADTTLSIGPRLQWNANDGYCGEVSFISAGLFYGQYCSQFTARALASPGVPQSRSSSQLLLGVNDAKAAAAMHLSATPWKAARGNTSKDFLTWVASQILAGRPVAIGVFTNEYLFYGKTSPTAGDPDYDHIVPVVAVSGTAPVTNGRPAYDAASTISFSDNGLWSPKNTPPYIFQYDFGAFQLTRKQANAQTGPIYALPTGPTNYGMAFNGVLDLKKDTVPVQVTTDINSELPAMKNGSNTAPAASRINLTVTVTIPDQTVEYNLYRYSDFKKVPDSKFNANLSKSSGRWRITRGTGPSYVLKLSILSSETAVFRAVRVTAP